MLEAIHEELRIANLLKLREIAKNRFNEADNPITDDDTGSIYAHLRTYVKNLEIDPAKNLKKDALYEKDHECKVLSSEAK